MSTSLKIGKIEAICLICIAITNQIILNMPKNIISSTGSSSWVNAMYISIIAIFIAWLIVKLFEKFTRV